MLQKANFTIFQNTSNISLKAQDLSRDPISITLSSSSFLYVGLLKPFSYFYAELNETPTTSSQIVLESFNGASWETLEIEDETLNLSRSGFISFDRTKLYKSNQNSNELFWVRVKSTSTHNISLMGITQVFSSDNELACEEPNITTDFYLNGKKSHILYHISSRQDIINSINKKANSKVLDKQKNEYRDTNVFDLNDIFELKQASIYLTLSKINFGLSDSVDDKYIQAYQIYKTKAEQCLDRFFTIDQNDDGIESNDVKTDNTPTVIVLKR